MADPYLSFERLVIEISPPWLTRTVAGALMRVFGRQIDALVDRTVRSIQLKFPGYESSALPFLGRDRRIARGSQEGDTSYAKRLREWWDTHRLRGGPTPLLNTAFALWSQLNSQIDLVYMNGGRRYVDTAGTLFRDQIDWSEAGGNDWAKFWLVFHLGADETGIVSAGGISESNAQSFQALASQWAPAHVVEARVALLWDGAEELWGYPQPVGLWGEPGDIWDPIQPPYYVVRFGRT